MQFTLLLANFGFIPFAVWAFLPAQDTDSPRSRTFRKIIIIATGALALFSLLYFAVSGPAKNAALRPDKILSLFLLLLSCIGLHLLILGRFIPLLRNAFRSEGALSERIIGGLCAAGIFLFIMGFALGFLNAIAEFFLESALGITAEAGLRYTLLNSSLTLILFSGWLLFALWLALGEWHRKPRFSFPIPETLARWHLVTFVCFLMMSLVLIALANPSGTIPDMFIQKVKFIASHALFALWICYGFAYLLKFLSTRKKTVLLQAGCALVLLTPLIPIAENYTNAYLVDISSAADQNNNDLGWQFGAYSLEGAPRIQCELSAAEEPPPNPLYPPPMTKDAVFFGGTDAGRFVPTYMIYSAKMREDVFLITQNALADGTYLDTMRGLYADQLWMPTTWDNSDAFNQYRIEVETGKRPNRGGISYGPGGGISVNGALAVMEINGILTEKLFEHNSARHDFYVEESYPIQWMMPFLRPHGLILKLEASPIAISPQEIRSDADFWDWYTRRLLNHPHFLRDIPARKGFSKLRSAIANILSLHRHTEEANRAWIQSQALYFRSPEPIFRRVQDVLLPQERYTDVLFLMDELEQLDPNMNTEPLEMARDLCRAGLRTEEAEKRLDAGEKLREEEFLELVHNYITLKKNTRLNMILNDSDRIVENPSPVLTCKIALVFRENQLYDVALSLLKSVDIKLLLSLPPADLDIIADVFLANRDWRTADQLLVKLLRDPQQSRTNFRAWCNLAYTSFHLSNPDRARRSFNCALSVNQQETYAYLQMMQDTVFLRFLFPPKANPRYPAGPVMHRP